MVFLFKKLLGRDWECKMVLGLGIHILEVAASAINTTGRDQPGSSMGSFSYGPKSFCQHLCQPDRPSDPEVSVTTIT